MPMKEGFHPGANTTYKGTGYGTLGAKAKSVPVSKDIEDRRGEQKSYTYVPTWQKRMRYAPPRAYPGQETDKSYMERAGRSYASRATKEQGRYAYLGAKADYLASDKYNELIKAKESEKPRKKM